MIAGQMLLTTAQSSTLPMHAAQELAAAEMLSTPPAPQIEAVNASLAACTQPETVVATMLGGYVAFVSATPIQPEAIAWFEKQMETMKAIYGEVIRDGYAGHAVSAAWKHGREPLASLRRRLPAPAAIAVTPAARCALCMCRIQ